MAQTYSKYHLNKRPIDALMESNNLFDFAKGYSDLYLDDRVRGALRGRITDLAGISFTPLVFFSHVVGSFSGYYVKPKNKEPGK